MALARSRRRATTSLVITTTTLLLLLFLLCASFVHTLGQSSTGVSSSSSSSTAATSSSSSSTSTVSNSSSSDSSSSSAAASSSSSTGAISSSSSTGGSSTTDTSGTASSSSGSSSSADTSGSGASSGSSSSSSADTSASGAVFNSSSSSTSDTSGVVTNSSSSTGASSSTSAPSSTVISSSSSSSAAPSSSSSSSSSTGVAASEPAVLVTIHFTFDISLVTPEFKSNFTRDTAAAIGIVQSRIVITSTTSGGVFLAFQIVPDSTSSVTAATAFNSFRTQFVTPGSPLLLSASFVQVDNSTALTNTTITQCPDGSFQTPCPVSSSSSTGGLVVVSSSSTGSSNATALTNTSSPASNTQLFLIVGCIVAFVVSLIVGIFACYCQRRNRENFIARRKLEELKKLENEKAKDAASGKKAKKEKKKIERVPTLSRNGTIQGGTGVAATVILPLVEESKDYDELQGGYNNQGGRDSSGSIATTTDVAPFTALDMPMDTYGGGSGGEATTSFANAPDERKTQDYGLASEAAQKAQKRAERMAAKRAKKAQEDGEGGGYYDDEGLMGNDSDFNSDEDDMQYNRHDHLSIEMTGMNGEQQHHTLIGETSLELNSDYTNLVYDPASTLAAAAELAALTGQTVAEVTAMLQHQQQLELQKSGGKISQDLYESMLAVAETEQDLVRKGIMAHGIVSASTAPAPMEPAKKTASNLSAAPAQTQPTVTKKPLGNPPSKSSNTNGPPPAVAPYNINSASNGRAGVQTAAATSQVFHYSDPAPASSTRSSTTPKVRATAAVTVPTPSSAVIENHSFSFDDIPSISYEATRTYDDSVLAYHGPLQSDPYLLSIYSPSHAASPATVPPETVIHPSRLPKRVVDTNYSHPLPPASWRLVHGRSPYGQTISFQIDHMPRWWKYHVGMDIRETPAEIQRVKRAARRVARKKWVKPTWQRSTSSLGFAVPFATGGGPNVKKTGPTTYASGTTVASMLLGQQAQPSTISSSSSSSSLQVKPTLRPTRLGAAAATSPTSASSRSSTKPPLRELVRDSSVSSMPSLPPTPSTTRHTVNTSISSSAAFDSLASPSSATHGRMNSFNSPPSQAMNTSYQYNLDDDDHKRPDVERVKSAYPNYRNEESPRAVDGDSLMLMGSTDEGASTYRQYSSFNYMGGEQ